MKSSGLMRQEASEAAERITDQLKGTRDLIQRLSDAIQAFDPQFVVLVGRGSSDHAGLFAKYLIEVELGIPVMHAAPSVVTLYNSPLKLGRALVIVISQSGQSPDLLRVLDRANQQSAMTLALVNDIQSPLAQHCQYVLPLCAGPEHAIAATKSVLASLVALLHLVSDWKGDERLKEAVLEAPEILKDACATRPQLKAQDLAGHQRLVVVGRGFGYAVGMEMALKLKEVCAIQAECFSSAEFFHGPVRILSQPYRLIDIQIQDEAGKTHRQDSQQLSQRGAEMISLCADPAVHPRLQPLYVLQRFYLDLETLGRELGFDTDFPEGLSKVTETL